MKTDTIIFYAITLSVILLLLLLPYLNIFKKRLTLAHSLKKACRACGAKFIPRNPFWIFARTKGNKCDFFIETEETLYCIKLFALKYKYNYMYIFLDGRYFTERYFYLLSHIGQVVKLLIHKSRPRSFEKCDFRYKMPESARLKYIVPIRLMNPVCYSFLREVKEGKFELIDIGQMINGYWFMNGSKLCDLLQHKDEAVFYD